MFESNVHAREKPRRSLWIAHWSLFVIYFGGADNLYNIHWTHEMRCVYTLVDAIGSQLLVLVPIPTFGDPNNYTQLQHLHQHQYHRIWCLVRFIMSVVCSIFDYIMMMMCWFAFHRGSDSYPRQSFPTVGVNWCCWLKYCRFSVTGNGNDMMQKSGFFDPMIPHLTLPLILYDGEIWTRLTTLFTDGFTHSTEGVISIGKDENVIGSKELLQCGSCRRMFVTKCCSSYYPLCVIRWLLSSVSMVSSDTIVDVGVLPN